MLLKLKNRQAKLSCLAVLNGSLFRIARQEHQLIPDRIIIQVHVQLSGLFLGIYIFHVHGGENLKSLTPDIHKARSMPTYVDAELTKISKKQGTI